MAAFSPAVIITRVGVVKHGSIATSTGGRASSSLGRIRAISRDERLPVTDRSPYSRGCCKGRPGYKGLIRAVGSPSATENDRVEVAS